MWATGRRLDSVCEPRRQIEVARSQRGDTEREELYLDDVAQVEPVPPIVGQAEGERAEGSGPPLEHL